MKVNFYLLFRQYIGKYFKSIILKCYIYFLLLMFFLNLTFKLNTFIRNLLIFQERIFNGMMIYHSKQQSYPIKQNINMEIHSPKLHQVNNLRLIYKEGSNDIQNPSSTSIHRKQKNNIKKHEIILGTKSSQIQKTELKLQKEKTNRRQMVQANKQSYSSIVQSQPIKIQSNKHIEKGNIDIICNNREDRKNNRFSPNKPSPQLLSPQNQQINRKKSESKNPFKKLFSYYFGTKESSQEEIQIDQNIYQIRDSNGKAISFNVQNSDLLGSFLGVMTAMNQIDVPNTKFLPGLDDEAINKISVLFKVDSDFLKKNQSCPICCSQYKEQQQALKLPCKHIYHQKCVKKWLHKKPLCPICKNNFKNYKK